MMRPSVALLVSLALGGCGPSFATALTPSGDPCADMPIFPAGQAVDRPYHRLRPVASSPKCGTEAERLESLRMAACKAGADAIIEATNEEARASDGAGYVTRASGTAVIWRRGPSVPRPIGVAPAPSQAPPPGPVETAPPAAK
jgi:hypothetical protein